MVETIIFVGALLCVEAEQKMVCQNKDTQNTTITFQRTVTDWQKITSQTNYNGNQEVKIERKNTCPGHQCPFN